MEWLQPKRRKEGKDRDTRVREEEREGGPSYLCVSPPCPQLALPTGREREPVYRAGALQSHPRAAGHSSTNPPALEPLQQLRPQWHGRYLAGRRRLGHHSRTASGSGSRRSRRPAARLPPRAGGYLEPAESTAPQPPAQHRGGSQPGWVEVFHVRKLPRPPQPC